MPMLGSKAISAEVPALSWEFLHSGYHSHPAEKDKPLCFQQYLTKEKLFPAAYFHCTAYLGSTLWNWESEGKKEPKSKAGNDFTVTSLRSQICLRNAHVWHSSSTKAPFPWDRTVRSTKAASPVSPSILSHRSAFNLDWAGKKLLWTPLQHLSMSWKHAHAYVKCKPSASALQSPYKG